MENKRFNTVANQKVVKVNKEPCNKANLYSTTNIEAEEYACRDLDGAEFKIWRYFSRNQNEYEFALSRADVINKTGLSDATYKRAIKSLTDKGYLVQTKGNRYAFYELPYEQEVEEYVPEDNDEFKERVDIDDEIEEDIEKFEEQDSELFEKYAARYDGFKEAYKVVQSKIDKEVLCRRLNADGIGLNLDFWPDPNGEKQRWLGWFQDYIY